MEIERNGNRFRNGLNQEFALEDGLVFGLLKSSDLKTPVISSCRKYTIVTQKRVGENTNYIKSEFPKTFEYLQQHKATLDARKSIIYKGKPRFSIFGIGEYSFKPYKVVISGLYKTFHFTLVPPQNGKPVMLDDTCYMLGFDTIHDATFTFILLNLEETKRFLQSITFPDAKRTFTKDVLMRIDLYALSKLVNFQTICSAIPTVGSTPITNATLDDWKHFVSGLKAKTHVESLAIIA
jgi:hypothetical protein